MQTVPSRKQHSDRFKMIPSKCSLAGIEIATVFDKTLADKMKKVGRSNYTGQQIVIDDSVVDMDMKHQVYYHELVHWILFIMGKDDLNADEEFIDLFGHLLYQAIKTAE